MNRKRFIESLGATCSNWNWSWSFINEKEKTIIFGSWDVHDDGNKSLILSESWSVNKKGRKSNGYPQSREHIRLVEEEGYKLLTFSMRLSEENRELDKSGPAKIGDFEAIAVPKKLVRVGNGWYASDEREIARIPEELPEAIKYKEGASKTILVNAYERNGKARKKCIEHFGCQCVACDFNFELAYGELGKGFIHVHHRVPLKDIENEYLLDPIKDLVPVCPNCHAMVHRTEPALQIDELRRLLGK